jgi:hypothetical protein
LLIDSSHKHWFAGTAVASLVFTATYWCLDWMTPGGLTGGSSVGLWYGLLGAGLMICAGLLAVLRKVPSWWWIGSRKGWLKGHIWLGLLSVVLILCHSRCRWGGALEQLLWVVLVLTLLTGVYGLAVQQFLPRWITTRVGCEAPYEQIPHLCTVMRRRADTLVVAVWGKEPHSDKEPQSDALFGSGAPADQVFYLESQVGIGAKVQLEEFYDRQVRPFLAERYQRRSPLADPLQAEAAFSRLRALPGLADVRDQLRQLEALCDERRQLAEQERLHWWLHGWLLLHVPLAVALLVLGVAHVVAALYY